VPTTAIFWLLIGVGIVVALACLVALRVAGARPGVARRLAGPPEVKVGTLIDRDTLPERPIRVAGRIRCREPLEMGGGERLVAFHRDVEVRIGGVWRSIERLRETRSFDLWDHDGSVTLDPSAAAEPLIVIPKVWRGDPAELEEPHASAVTRLAERHGAVTEARATTRSLNVTDRLLVLASARRDSGAPPRLDPPPGGYLITNLALDDAMRLLGGRNRRLVAGSLIASGLAAALVAIGVIGLAVATIVGP
jgi:hypothetical protein